MSLFTTLDARPLARIVTALSVIAVLVGECHGFATVLPAGTATMRSSLPLLHLSTNSNSGNSNNNRDDNDELPPSRESIVARNNARTCVKSFLTQRAIQSFMYLLEECRDPHSGKWIEDFLGLTNLVHYHGTGAFNISRFESWEMVLLEMMEQPKDQIIVSAKRRGRGHGGWSKNNPYLEERWVDFSIDIDPASLAQRILSVRGQIANEFVQDLDIVISTNNQILDSYFDHIRQEEHDKQQQTSDPSLSSSTSSSSTTSAPNKSPQELASSFDRLTSLILSSNMESQVVASSPFREGNFDLLYNLCTQTSIHELLRELQDAGGDREVSFAWLRDFYVDRAEEFFDGDQPYGRADDFIEVLLLTPPAVRDLGTNDARTGKAVVGLIDPLGLAEQIIARRTQIANRWKAVMGETASDHTQLQKVLLAKIMGKPLEDFKRDAMQKREDETSAGRPAFD